MSTGFSIFYPLLLFWLTFFISTLIFNVICDLLLVADVKAKINSLRTRTCSKESTTSRKSGSGRDEVFKSKWPYFQSLQFLRDSITPRNCLVSYILQKQSFAIVLQIRCSWKFRKFHRKTPVLESLFNKVAGLQALLKRVSNTDSELFKNKFFYRTPPVAASNITTYLKYTFPYFLKNLVYPLNTADSAKIFPIIFVNLYCCIWTSISSLLFQWLKNIFFIPPFSRPYLPIFYWFNITCSSWCISVRRFCSQKIMQNTAC